MSGGASGAASGSASGAAPGSADAPGPSGAAPAVSGTPKGVGVAWALLGLNTLGSAGAKTVVPLPRSLIQMGTMGALVAAFALALALNPRVRIRPSAFVFLLTLLLVPSLIASVQLEVGLGALFRCARLALFVATLWLLSRWWDGSLTFVRYHVRMYFAVLVLVAVGLAVAPGTALPEYYGGRLVGALWPLTPPQIGQYAAVVIGLTVLLLLGRRTGGAGAALVIVPSLVLLAMTHTRTATLGLVIGLVLAIGSLVLTSGAARRFFAWAVLCAAVAAVVFSSALRTWFLRGQSQENFSNLTGRAKVWDALLAAPRTPGEEAFGVGLSDKSFDGLPIDNSWLAVYHEQGLVGVAIVAAMIIALGGVALLRPPSLPRACAIFLIGYCALSSYTEVGLGDASAYLLHLTLAASLLAVPAPAAPLPAADTPRRRVPRWARR
ncbi:O-antigen ligase domain-containing protein [Streptomyces omiyaensis]|uniref:O-antigen ligase domain-containing protein n=1 Tax=Streptomyces omiyaensis TaxID=68247 RepID=A0ABW7BV49_9ACTN|nr:O-antigen ligase domain-containing protein [Streptomyces omiyaensis]